MAVQNEVPARSSSGTGPNYDRLVVNMSSVAAYPTGLGSYATRLCRHIMGRYACSILAPPHVALPDGASRIATPAGVAIGGGGSRLARIANLVQRQAFYLHGPVRKDDFIYNPTHHGFFNSDRQIITIHDLISLHHPEIFPRQVKFFRRVMPILLRKSSAIFVVSEFTKMDVQRFFGIDSAEIHVVPNIFDASSIAIDTNIKRKDFLLVVGCHLPHKNLEELIRFRELWCRKYTLKIVGAKGYYGDIVKSLVRDANLSDQVEFLPFVSEPALDTLYREAAALVYPSTVEGFGLPPLEALARGTPSIVSDIPVHREVMSDAALFVELGNEASWAQALGTIEAHADGNITAEARRAVLDRFSPTTVGKQFDRALLAVAPQLQRFRLGDGEID